MQDCLKIAAFIFVILFVLLASIGKRSLNNIIIYTLAFAVYLYIEKPILNKMIGKCVEKVYILTINGYF